MDAVSGDRGFDFLVETPAGAVEPSLAIAGSRAGAIGVLDLRFGSGDSSTEAAVARLKSLAHGRWAVLVDAATGLPGGLRWQALVGSHAVVVAADGPDLAERVSEVHSIGALAFVETSDVDIAEAAQSAGADAVIGKGHEAGGWIGEEGSFVLLQRLTSRLRIPVWVHGGVGLHTAAACAAVGAAGAVLDSQVLLARESQLPRRVRERVSAMDGSETVCVGTGLGAPFRTLSRPDLGVSKELDQRATALEMELARGHDRSQIEGVWRAEVRGRVAWDDRPGAAVAIGQDGAFAAELARRFVTVGGIVNGIGKAVREQLAAVRASNPLAPGSALATSHGTELPIVQGPMTRVSDTAQFAASVAHAAALPFLALSLMRAPDVRALLDDTRDLVGQRPWGVGILGFVPAELREEQLEVVRAAHPPFALIAGGRPDQARALEEHGTATYLHVPSPALLRIYLKDGAQRFVFEGRECGGHVGPRTSFVLWESMVGVLLDELPAGDRNEDIHVLFAGGIHDGVSAAMAASIAAPLVSRGVRVGVLMGTAYLFTDEAVQHGAITAAFQRAAIASQSTVLLESGPGHATRCLPSPFVDEFAAERRRMLSEAMDPAERRNALEELNIGRLRIATKGTMRSPQHERGHDHQKLVVVTDEDQWRQGMYMIGQVAVMHDGVRPMRELHDEVVSGCAAVLGGQPHIEPTPEAAVPPADIAIVGIGAILPGAADASAFWSNILSKVDAVTEIPPTRWDWRRYFDTDRTTPDKVYSRWGGFVDDVEFDPVAFGMPPNSLTSIEPFQLLGLLTAHAALRDAGYEHRPFPRERTSVIFGAGGGGADLAVGYTVRSALPALIGDDGDQLIDTLGDRLPAWTEDSFPGLLMNVAAGRIANRLDLGGINFTVDAACGSSLAAITLAVRDLESGLSDMAVVGGVDAIQNPFAYLCFAKTQALSPNGRCRPFDAAADGIAISEGFAAVILKRRSDAERDGDRIYAVIRGVGAASDGRDRSLTAPRPEGQMRSLRRAYAHARISPSTIGLIEAHGTGTVAGDRAEIEALQTIYDAAGARRQGCAIGSVKSMIGHTKATAGVVGLIKAALSLHHRVLPPTLGVTTPNPRADFAATPFYVNTEARPWVHPGIEAPRRAAVSAFGFGGTNYHVVLEEYTGGYLPGSDAVLPHWPAELFLWRRDTTDELAQAIDELAAGLQQGRRPDLADLAFTLSTAFTADDRVGPTVAIVADSVDDLAAKLGVVRAALRDGDVRMHAASGVHFSREPLALEGSLAFIFPGQGSQVVDMGRELAIVFPEARASLDRSDHVLAGRHDKPLSHFMFPPPAFTDEERRARQAELTETNVAQPALGAIELAYLHVLRSLGVEADLVGGHSFGEFVALAAAGSLREDDLLRLSEARGRFIREEAGEDSGAMAAVDAGPDALRELTGHADIVLANLNGPQQTVVSGSRMAIEQTLAWCKSRRLPARQLPVACAFHSPLVAAAQRRLAESLAETKLSVPRIPVFSNTTAARYSDDPTAIVATLTGHLVAPVAFSDEVLAMHRAGARVFLEVGPRNVLTGLVSRILDDRPHLAVALDQPGRDGSVQLLHALAALAAEGVTFRIERLFRGRPVEPLDVRTLEPPAGRPAPSRTAWLVNGGRARPASEPTPTPRAQLDLAELFASNTNGGRSHGRPLEEVAAPLPSPSTTPPADEERFGEILNRHHRVMQHFLETQKTVMLAYLGQAGGQARVVPADRPTRAATQVAPVKSAQAEIAPAPPSLADKGDLSEPASTTVPVDVSTRLLEIVSERTGFPQDMLGLDADLESDLGIDSIKRVEIAGTLTQEMRLPDGVEIDVEELTASRTLRQVIAVVEKLSATTDPAVSEPAGSEQDSTGSPIGRYLLRAVDAPTSTDHAGLSPEGEVLIVGDGAGIGAEVARLLAARGEESLLVPALDTDAVAPVLGELREQGARVKALVYLAALDGEPDLGGLLLLAKGVCGDLEMSASAGGAALIGVTRLGGTFGVGGEAGEPDPTQGVVPGVLKCLAHEWPDVRVKVMDIDPGEAGDVAPHVLDELFADDGLVEVGWRGEKRVVLELAASAIEGREPVEPLDGASVVLLTGGARGITAEIARTLAARYRPTLVLVGRTRVSDDGEEAGPTDPGELQRSVIERRRRAGDELTPKAVADEVRQILAVREVQATCEQIRAAGARVEYRSCDVRNAEALEALVDDVYAAHGRIDGVVHGAGLIEDKLVRDKDVVSASRVFATKADAARVLAGCLRPESLRFLILFSSVSGRFGNRGQADYAAASEVLNKLAEQLDRRWPTRVVAVNWGPWAGAGMVSPEVARQFAARGVALVGVQEGCRWLDEELRLGRKGEVEVLIGGLQDAVVLPDTTSHGAFMQAPNTLIRHDAGRVEVIRRLEPEQDLLLSDHRIDGVPVLPFAGAMELMAQTAAAAHPELEVAEMRDIELNRGVRLEESSLAVRVVAVPAEERAGIATFVVTIDADGEDRPRYRSTVVLTERLDAGEPEDGTPALGPMRPFPLTVAQAYAEYLFHGPLFQRIEAIEGVGEHGALANLRASEPDACLHGVAPGTRWLLDPVLIDCALQMQVLWCRMHWGLTLLPARIAGYRRFAPPPDPSAPSVRHELRVLPSSRVPMCVVDHRLIGPSGLLATLTGVTGVGSKALNRLSEVPA
jgi:acyl transferase domain-containing protein/NAD(P)H-dependent flavin oxidoreductase YrpB (nitropropane dioxygenase family)